MRRLHAHAQNFLGVMANLRIYALLEKPGQDAARRFWRNSQRKIAVKVCRFIALGFINPIEEWQWADERPTVRDDWSYQTIKEKFFDLGRHTFHCCRQFVSDLILGIFFAFSATKTDSWQCAGGSQMGYWMFPSSQTPCKFSTWSQKIPAVDPRTKTICPTGAAAAAAKRSSVPA